MVTGEHVPGDHQGLLRVHVLKRLLRRGRRLLTRENLHFPSSSLRIELTLNREESTERTPL